MSIQKRNVDSIKSTILSPSLTSLYEVKFPARGGKGGDEASAKNAKLEQDELTILCSNTVLPGSSFDTHEMKDTHTGVTELIPYRRTYDNRIDLTFYVDKDHTPIKYFEKWMSDISGESDDKKNLPAYNYSYRMKFPKLDGKGYVSSEGFKITKFEKQHQHDPQLIYHFVRSYPIAINSMQVGYDTSSVLKCTVTMAYTRYFIVSAVANPPKEKSSGLNKELKDAVAKSQKNEPGSTNGKGSIAGERSSVTGELVDGRSDGPVITTRQALGLDPI